MGSAAPRPRSRDGNGERFQFDSALQTNLAATVNNTQKCQLHQKVSAISFFVAVRKLTSAVLWAQRSSATDEAKNIVYLTAKIVDSKNLKVVLTETSLHLESDTEDGSDHYLLNIDFFKEVDPKLSHHSHNGNRVYFVLRKAEKQEEYWPRLTKEKAKHYYIKTDFDKWVDEDEQDEVEPEEEQQQQQPMPPMGGDDNDMWANMLKQNPQLAQLGAMGMGGGDFDMSKLAGGDESTSGATEADFSSSDDDDESKVNADTIQE